MVSAIAILQFLNVSYACEPVAQTSVAGDITSTANLSNGDYGLLVIRM